MAPSPAKDPAPPDSPPDPPGLAAFKRLEHLVRALERDTTVAEAAFILDLEYDHVLALIRTQDNLVGDFTVGLDATGSDPAWLWTVYALRTAP